MVHTGVATETSNQEPKRTIRMVLAYDGTRFVGWQKQRNGLSVQEVLEQALAALTGEVIVAHASGRTDAGVHALGQVVSFLTHSTLSLHAFVHGTNAHLPADVVVHHAEEVDAAFHARFSARGKQYQYQIWNAPTLAPLHRFTHWHLRNSLDTEAMQQAGLLLVGKHDFGAFRASDCTRRDTVRTIHRVEVSAKAFAHGKTVHITLEGDGFLKNMVRIITGTLVQVGQHKRLPTSLEPLLRSGDRTQAGPTAPPHGLVLCEVYYGAAGEPG